MRSDARFLPWCGELQRNDHVGMVDAHRALTRWHQPPRSCFGTGAVAALAAALSALEPLRRGHHRRGAGEPAVGADRAGPLGARRDQAGRRSGRKGTPTSKAPVWRAQRQPLARRLDAPHDVEAAAAMLLRYRRFHTLSPGHVGLCALITERQSGDLIASRVAQRRSESVLIPEDLGRYVAEELPEVCRSA